MSERRPSSRRKPPATPPSPSVGDGQHAASDQDARGAEHASSPPPQERKKRLRRPRTPEPPRRVEETVDTAIRLFIAVPLPEDVIALVDRTVETLKREPWPVKWSDAHNAHITLHFLGEVDPAAAEVLRLALAVPIGMQDAFELRTADLGAFPTIRKPRVLWLGLWGPVHRLETLHASIGRILEQLEFKLEEREFRPHITMGRVRADNARGQTLAQAIRTRFEAMAAHGEVTNKRPVPIPVHEVHLVRSHLTSKGARYEVIARYPLRSPDDPA